MPVTLVFWLPLPNLKVYTAGSVLLLTVAVYHALCVTSDPNWRLNATQQQPESSEGTAETSKMLPPMIGSSAIVYNKTRHFNEQLIDVMTYLMQEPLCMWTVMNVGYCLLAVVGLVLQRVVFGPLREPEAQRMKDRFWNYVFYKFIFVFGVLNVQYMDEVLLWCTWFTLLGFFYLLGHLCKDRYEYLSSTGLAGSTRLAAPVLLTPIAVCALACAAPLPAAHPAAAAKAFVAAECALAAWPALQTAVRSALAIGGAPPASRADYYTRLAFDMSSACLALAAAIAAAWGAALWLPAAALLLQARAALTVLRQRLQQHRLYAHRTAHVQRSYPMATKEEVESNEDKCAICWEPMEEARKLPCSHLFHNSCLCQWMQHDASCPTCRHALLVPPGMPSLSDDEVMPPPPRVNPILEFDWRRLAPWWSGHQETRLRRTDHTRRQMRQLALSLLQPERAQSQGQQPHQGGDPVSDSPTPLATEQFGSSAGVEVDHGTSTGFGASAVDREQTLLRRRRQLLAAARERYIRQHQQTDASSTT